MGTGRQFDDCPVSSAPTGAPTTTTTTDESEENMDENPTIRPDREPSYLVEFIVLFVVIAFLLFNNINYSSEPLKSEPLQGEDPICQTPICVHAASQILNNMDNETDPCDDFYQFACGNKVRTREIPDEKTSVSIFSQIAADLNAKLRALVESQPRDGQAPIVSQLMNMYASCMNETDIERRGNGPLLEVLKDLGGWPVISYSVAAEAVATATATEPPPSVGAGPIRARRRRRRLDRRQSSDDISSWLEVMGKFRERGFSHNMIIDLSMIADPSNADLRILALNPGTLGLPHRSYYFKGLNETVAAAYYKMMVESAVMLGADKERAELQMLEAFEFETELAHISLLADQRRNANGLYDRIPAQDLYKLAPNIDWQRYFTLLLRDNSGFDVAKDDILVKVPSFITALDGLLLKTEPRIIANYMIWRIVRSSMNGLSRRWRELAFTYSAVITGRRKEEPRWEQCLNSLHDTLFLGLSALYVKNHFNQHSKAAALEIVDYTRREFLRILDEIDWMDEETREEAKSKARAMSHFIGYPGELLEDKLIEDYHKGIEIGRENFYQNTRRLQIWWTNRSFSQLKKPNNRSEWTKHARAVQVNASYRSTDNSIEFLAGILQGAFFDAGRPKYLNFGAIGYVIGHEITHGFDGRGRHYDKSGNVRNWWRPETVARFKERVQCMISQYGNYTVSETGARVNGLTTSDENIADNGGIKQAFRSYRRWSSDHGREARLPALNYAPEQLFWISAANVWCDKVRPEELRLRQRSGAHTPARYRVIGPFSNSPEFAHSFNCPSGSPMNPRQKCSVW